MKNIILNIGENGAVVSSDNCLGNSGEHNKTVLKIIISDESLLSCDYFRIWFDNRYSVHLFHENGTIEYEVPQDALMPPYVKFQLCGFCADQNGIYYVAKSQKFTFNVETSDSSRALCGKYIEPAEMLSYECGMAAKKASEAAEISTGAALSAESSAESAKTSAEVASQAAQTVSDKTSWQLISEETIQGGTENLSKIGTNYEVAEHREGVGLLYGGEITLFHPINPGTLTGNLYSGTDEENPAGTFTDDGSGNIVTDLPYLVGTVDYQNGKITFTELGIDVPYTLADITYQWGTAGAVTSYIKDLGGKYKKLAVFFTIAHDSEFTSKGYINLFANGNENADRIISAGTVIPMPTASGKVTLVKILSEMVGEKAVSTLQYLNDTTELSGRYLQTTGDLANTWFPIKKDYIETLQIEAVTMAFTVGTKIEIYGVKA